MINILHLAKWPLGGSTSYVVHLSKTLEKAGVKHRILRVSKKTEKSTRELGSYGVQYWNVSLEKLASLKGSFLLASSPTDKDACTTIIPVLEGLGAFYVFHDPNEFAIYPHWEVVNRKRVICVREAGLKHMPKGVFIRHPYVRTFKNSDLDFEVKRKFALSIARTSAVKHSDWIIESNITEGCRPVELCGSVNRMWWNFNIKKKFPDYPYPTSADFPREFGAAPRLCIGYDFMVDLTVFKDDGGGTQYSFLEAMDAGAVPVATSDWCSYPGDAKDFCVEIADPEELRAFTSSKPSRLKRAITELRESNLEYLKKHRPSIIAEQFASVLSR